MLRFSSEEATIKFSIGKSLEETFITSSLKEDNPEVLYWRRSPFPKKESSPSVGSFIEEDFQEVFYERETREVLPMEENLD